ncbi:MAG TPA: M23 family metallopeptidase [Clostridia bacterium]|nr:M23 family metallopeptidase [Clostridia bacterium]
MSALAKTLSKVLLSFFEFDIKDIIKFLIFAVLIPFLLIALLFAGPITGAEKLPLINTEQIKMYIDVANKVSESTGSKYSERVQINWRQLVAIDAVRFQQDFSKANSYEIEELAKMFIEKVDEVEERSGEPPNEIVEVYPIYKLRSLDEVLNLLNFSASEKEKVKEFIEFDFSLLLNSAANLPDNWIAVEKNFKWPVPGVYRITSGFGPRVDPVYETMGFHSGIDIAAPTGTIVIAAADGEVGYAGWNGGYGNVIYITHNGGYETRYAHLSSIAVKQRQIVKSGDVIGYVGSTGKSTGSHLHFEVRIGGRAVNPLDFFK